MHDNKIELTQVNVSHGNGKSGPPAPRDDASFIETQTRTRRLFSSAQIFCFALVYFGTWSSIGTYVQTTHKLTVTLQSYVFVSSQWPC